MLYLRSLDYEEKYFDAQTETLHQWELKDLKFSQFTIIAGLNSSGKSRTCNVIRNTVKKIIGTLKQLQIGNTNLIIDTSEDKSYRIVIDIEEVNHKKVIKGEELYEEPGSRNTLFPNIEKLLFNRKTIFDCQQKTDIPYSPPDDSLTFHVRRDKVSYPYLEEIVAEMKKFYFLNFEEPRGVAIGIIPESGLPIEILPSYTPLWVDRIDLSRKREILDCIESLGFPIKDMFTKQIILAGQKVPMLYIEEKHVNGIYDFTQASSGMLKIIFLIVFLHLIEKGSSVLIDNVGDGLDYKRSINILPILNDIAEEKQIIICTNNEILLNQTDIRNWNIFYREGSIVRAFNYENSKEQLLKFAETGLSNYEYFQNEYFLK
jgi:predicted ATPase